MGHYYHSVYKSIYFAVRQKPFPCAKDVYIRQHPIYSSVNDVYIRHTEQIA